MKTDSLKAPHVTALIYGPPGIGKTTLLGSLPGKTLIIDVDRGTSVLSDSRNSSNIDIVRLGDDLKNLPEIISELRDGGGYQNICLDTLSELINAMLTYLGRVGKNDGVPSMADYGRVNMKLMDYCRQLRALPANVVFTAWAENAEITARDGTKYSQLRPSLRDKIADNVCGLCDLIGFIDVSVKDEHKGERFIRLEGDPGVVAKDRIAHRKFCKFDELIKETAE